MINYNILSDNIYIYLSIRIRLKIINRVRLTSLKWKADNKRPASSVGRASDF